MFKNRLQEVCHKKKLPMPKYTTIRDGPDHNPRFKASVVFGDVSFDCPDFCKPSKEVQGEAARVDFDHLDTQNLPPTLGQISMLFPLFPSPGSSTAKDEAPTLGSTSNITETDWNSVLEMEFSCKSQLQCYAQKRNINLPSYDCIRQGSFHNTTFKGRVTVDGQTFQSIESYNSLKEAENAAAKCALLSLSKEANQDVPLVFKSMLQELVQKQCLSSPVMNGPPHLPVFVSTVEVVGEKFVGVCATTKKQAEQNAARIAFQKLNVAGPKVTDESQHLGVNSIPISCNVVTVSSDECLMEVHSDFVSILSRVMNVEKPFLPPKTWESVPSESGTPADCVDSASKSIYEPSVISEAALVRMVINALQGNQAAVDDIEKLSSYLLAIPSDRTIHRVPNLWHKLSSSAAIGKMLKSISWSGHIFFCLRKFVNHFLHTPKTELGANLTNCKINAKSCNAVAKKRVQNNLSLPVQEFLVKELLSDHPPYSLVNQAFAVSVKRVLEGYLRAINTLSASVKLRRSVNSSYESADDSNISGSLISIVDSDITLLEAYLHTKELRVRMEALGNICFLGLDVSKGLDASDSLKFDYFPRGADLLTYLYAQLRDSDSIHHGLLRFLFIRSCEPYNNFIRSWIYKGKIDDPHREFIVDIPYSMPSFPGSASYTNGISLTTIMERDGISVPCFLKVVQIPLFRAGQQLQVLIKLLELCNCSLAGGESNVEDSVACSFSNFEDVLPFWRDNLGDQCSYLYSTTFYQEEIRKISAERVTMYKESMEKLKIFFEDLKSGGPHVKNLVTSCGFVPPFSRRNHVNSTFNLTDELDCFGYNFDTDDSNMAMDTESTEISSTSDNSFSEQDIVQFSESSYLDTSEEESEPLVTVSDMKCEASSLSYSLADRDGYERLSKIGELLAVRKIYDEIEQKSEEHIVDALSVCPPAGKDATATSDSAIGGYNSCGCWPLGGMLKNPFHAEGNRSQDLPNFIKSSASGFEREMKPLEVENINLTEIFMLDNVSKLENSFLSTENGTNSASSIKGVQPWVSTSKYNLSRNPTLGEASSFHATSNIKNKAFMPNGRSHPYFDFSRVAPHNIFLDKLNTFNSYGTEDLGTIGGYFDISNVQINECVPDGNNVGRLDKRPSSPPSCSSRTSEENKPEKDFSGIVSGGADWEVSLRYSEETGGRNRGNFMDCSSELPEIPLDVIVERCILQEILLQYNYISKFTIRLLDEGFSLREHLMALRRYHFMELADWADSFVTSLWNYKWHIAEPNHSITELQSLLHVALQRSSCQNDPFRERLFLDMKEHTTISPPTSALGVLNFIFLGYNVDWPITIVVSAKALGIYADIFSFLMQARLALFSLSDTWNLLKELLHSRTRGEYVATISSKEFSTFVKLRLQVNHFVTTFQQYVQSQLSNVSWCKFLYSLKHQVKDMMDLESVHMSYLSDALHICFLSPETQPIAGIVKCILQCALDFQSCIIRCDVSKSLLSQINFSQVLAIKASFEKSVEDLYVCYLSSPRHSESGICRFWNLLNFNDYYLKSIALTRY